MFKIGSHVGMSGKKMFLGSVEEALSYGANTFMIYTGAPQNTKRKPIEELNIEAGLKLMEENNISVEDIVVHAPTVALETMAGKGSECGRNFEEIAKIIDGVKLKDKLSVCFDTCHVNDAGYDIVNDFEGVMEEFDKIVGIDRI